MKKFISYILLISILILTIIYAKPKSMNMSSALSDEEMNKIIGEGWLSCLGVVAGAIGAISAIIASGGLVGVAAVATAASLSAAVLCGCAKYIDRIAGTNLEEAC
jgi:hypothetical protein